MSPGDRVRLGDRLVAMFDSESRPEPSGDLAASPSESSRLVAAPPCTGCVQPRNGRGASLPHFDATPGHVPLGLGDAVLPEVEDARGEHRIGAAFGDAVGEMVQAANAARGDDRDGDRG